MERHEFLLNKLQETEKRLSEIPDGPEKFILKYISFRELEDYSYELHLKTHIVLTPLEAKMKEQRYLDMLEYDIDQLTERFNVLSLELNDHWGKDRIKLSDLKMELRALNKEIISKTNIFKDRKFSFEEKYKNKA